MKELAYEVMETAVGTYAVRVHDSARKTYLLHDGFRTREGAAEWIEQQRQMAAGIKRGNT